MRPVPLPVVVLLVVAVMIGGYSLWHRGRPAVGYHAVIGAFDEQCTIAGNVLTPDFQRAADNLRGFLAAHGHETAPESDGITYDTLARRELLQRNRADCPRAVQRALKQ